DALAVGRLVVQHVGRFYLEAAGGELGAHGALHVVAAADAIDVGIPAIGDLLVGVRGRDHRERIFLVDLRRRDGHAGVQVADAGSGAAPTAEMTATPSAPARTTSATLSCVMPPIPMRGTRISPRSFRIRSGPTSWNSGLVAVANIEPTAT